MKKHKVSQIWPTYLYKATKHAAKAEGETVTAYTMRQIKLSTLRDIGMACIKEMREKMDGKK